MIWKGHVAHMREMRNARKNLVRKPEGKRSFDIPMHRYKDTITMDLKEIECDSDDWIQLLQDRDKWWALVKMEMNLWAP
jgi:hypothetical protein